MERRYNIEEGCWEIKVQVEGLPAIWMSEDGELCERCKPFGECLGLETEEDRNGDERAQKVKAKIDKNICGN